MWHADSLIMIIAKKICNYVNIAYVNACINSETRCIDADVETHAINVDSRAV